MMYNILRKRRQKRKLWILTIEGRGATRGAEGAFTLEMRKHPAGLESSIFSSTLMSFDCGEDEKMRQEGVTGGVREQKQGGRE
eukprot:754937-Hanusia_phi.AAC.2